MTRQGAGPPEGHEFRLGPEPFVHCLTRVLDPPAMVRETAKNDITLGHRGKIRNKPNLAQANCKQWVTVGSERRG